MINLIISRWPKKFNLQRWLDAQKSVLAVRPILTNQQELKYISIKLILAHDESFDQTTSPYRFVEAYYYIRLCQAIFDNSFKDLALPMLKIAY